MVFVKSKLKEGICKQIDEYFDNGFGKSVSELSKEYENMINLLSNAKTEAKSGASMIEKISNLLYKQQNFSEIISIYKKLNTVAPIQKPCDTTTIEKTQEKISKVKFKELAEEIKEKFSKILQEINIFEYGTCEKCKKEIKIMKCVKCGLRNRKLCENCYVLKCKKCNMDIATNGFCEKCYDKKELCNKCENEVNKITWTNGQKIIQGGNGVLKTFCSNKILPEFFKCKIKAHQAFNPNSGNRFIGLSRNQCDEDNGNYYCKSTDWYAIHNNVGAWSKTDGYKKRGALTYGDAGDIVSVIYDRTKSIKFEVNGVSTGQSFDNIEGPFYLACSDNSNSTYEIIDIISL